MEYNIKHPDKFRTLEVEGRVVSDDYTVKVDGRDVTARELLIALRSHDTKKKQIARSVQKKRAAQKAEKNKT